MLHLYRYRQIDLDSVRAAPREMIQDGISMAVGIRRSHASLILGRMAEKELVESRKKLAETADGRFLRKVYNLSPKGLATCEGLLGELGWQNPLPLDINHCCSSEFDSLDRKERDIVGMVMVLDGRIPRETVGDGRQLGILPVDGAGRFCVSDDTRKRYISRAEPDELRRWHSMAADWCMDNRDNLKERLKHLVDAGRNIEAVRLIKDNRYSLADSPDRMLAETVDRLAVKSGDSELSAIASLMFMRLSMGGNALEAASRVGDPCIRGALRSEAMLLEGRNEDALNEALNCYCGDIPTSMALGKSMSANGRHEEAVIFLRKCRRCMTEVGCLFRLDEVLGCEAESYFQLGRRDLALALMDVAISAAMDPAARDRFRNRTEVMASEDRVGLEGVHV